MLLETIGIGVVYITSGTRTAGGGTHPVGRGIDIANAGYDRNGNIVLMFDRVAPLIQSGRYNLRLQCGAETLGAGRYIHLDIGLPHAPNDVNRVFRNGAGRCVFC